MTRHWQAVEELAAINDPFEYERGRKKIAKEFGVTERTVEKAVTIARQKQAQENRPGHALRIEDVEPWPEPVNGNTLLIRLWEALGARVNLSDESQVAVTIWTLYSHAFQCFGYSPILHAKSPDKRCGKSTLLEFIRHTSNRPLKSANTSGAALFRAVEKWKPTLLIDELDSQAETDKRKCAELRNLLNAGFEQGNPYLRSSGENFEPVMFDVFCPKAVASIGSLPDTAADRAIVVAMRPKLKTEKVKRLRDAGGTLAELQAKCARWARDHAEALRQARPKIPDELNDRQADIWEPLLAVADLCGGDWPNWARETAVRLCAEKSTGEMSGVALLKDIRSVFDQDLEVERIERDCLLLALNKMDEAPWSTIRRGKELNAHRLGMMLAEFGIEARQWRNGRERERGYYREGFEDAWTRYLS